MKLLVVSNVSGSIDKIVDAVQQSHNVVAKEVSVSTSALAQTVGDQLRGGSYDEAIVIARDPIGAGMALNKQEGVEAAVCSNLEDAQLAKKNGANVIVIRNLDSEEVMDVINESVGSGGMIRNLKNIKMPKMPQKQAAVEEEPEPQAQAPAPKEKPRAAKMGKKAEPQQPAEEEQEPEEASPPSRPGIVGKIKDFLGIM